MTQLIRIINHITNLNNDADILDYLDEFQYINKIFNKSQEDIQIDFIKQLFNKIKLKDKFKDYLPFFKMQSIYTINKLLDFGINYNDYNMCYFVLNHKDKNVVININEYNEFENRTNNKELALLFNEFRMKEAYMKLDSDSDSCDSDSCDSNNSDSDSNSSSINTDDIELTSDSENDSIVISSDTYSYCETTYSSESESESESDSNSDDEIRTRDIKIIDSDYEIDDID